MTQREEQGRVPVPDEAPLPAATGRYGNFPELAEGPVELLFGGNCDRLVEVKPRQDPENPFRRNRTIRPQPAV
jgi:hypothetical protein